MLASSSVNAFSPITLFESTLTNATMLTETMSQTELLTAHQISSRLQNGIVEALHKLSEGLAREVECQRAAAETAQAHLQESQARVQVAEARAALGGSVYKAPARLAPGVKFESGSGAVLRKFVSEPAFNCADATGGSGFSVKCEAESDEDCVLLDESSSQSVMQLYGGEAGNGAPARKRPAMSGQFQHEASFIEMDPKVALRTAYRQIVGNGPPLFDVTKSLTEGLNRSVAESVIDRAKQLCPNLLLSDDQWQNSVLPAACLWQQQQQQDVGGPQSGAAAAATDDHFLAEARRKGKLRKRRTRSKLYKLQRRQKSYTELRSQLSTEEAAKFQYILSRDVTSSDEELEGVDGATRVRQLAWESAEAADMKRRLDTLYFERFATDKQQLAHQRCLRDGQAESARGMPDCAPLWMRKSSAGRAATGGSAQIPLVGAFPPLEFAEQFLTPPAAEPGSGAGSAP